MYLIDNQYQIQVFIYPIDIWLYGIKCCFILKRVKHKNLGQFPEILKLGENVTFYCVFYFNLSYKLLYVYATSHAVWSFIIFKDRLNCSNCRKSGARCPLQYSGAFYWTVLFLHGRCRERHDNRIKYITNKRSHRKLPHRPQSQRHWRCDRKIRRQNFISVSEAVQNRK